MVDRPPVIAAWGGGVESTAMIVELAERGEPVDMVLFADPGAEKSATYAFIPVFRILDRNVASRPRSSATDPGSAHGTNAIFL